jgi:hypothetical protein
MVAVIAPSVPDLPDNEPEVKCFGIRLTEFSPISYPMLSCLTVPLDKVSPL